MHGWRATRFVLVSTLCACTGKGEPAPRSALIITLDTTRADALGCYGGPADATPALDALAAESVLYECARTVAPMTLPAHSSMMTGLYPIRHSARDNSVNRLPKAAVTLAERARERGFETAAIVAAAVLDPGVGIAQGFEHYDPVERTGAAARAGHVAERRAGDVLARARAWFEQRDTSRPFLCWVHLFDAHLPYEPPAAFAEQAGGSAYHGEVAYMDRAVGELIDLLRAQGELETTLVLVVGDHGEGLFDHAEEAHATFVYDSTMRVPFLVRSPDGIRGARAGERSREIVSVVDVFPTVVDALELGRAGDIDGRSLWRTRVPDDRGVYFESYYGYLQYGWSPLAGWADANGKYVHATTPELFDVARDPGELENLIDAGADAARYQAAIDALAAKSRLTPDREIDPDLLSDLQSLGYLTGGSAATDLPHPLEPTGLPDARVRQEVLRRTFEEVAELERGGDVDEAATRLHALIAANPRNVYARERLSLLCVANRRWEAAVEAGQGLLEHGFDTASTHNNLGLALAKLERFEEACTHLRRAHELDDQSPLVRKNLVGVLRELGRDDEARAIEAAGAAEAASDS